MNRPGRKREYSDPKHEKLRERVARWRLKRKTANLEMQQVKKAFLAAFLGWTLLNVLFITLVSTPAVHAKMSLSFTTGLVDLGTLGNQDTFILGSYLTRDKFNPDIVWVGGKKNNTNYMRVLKLNWKTGDSTVISDWTTAVGTRSYMLDNDATNVYVPSSDSGHFIVINKVTLAATTYPLFGSGDPVQISMNPMNESDPRVYYIIGGDNDVGDGAGLGYYTPATGIFTNYTYVTQGDWAFHPIFYEDVMYFLLKEGAWMGRWNWTDHTYTEKQLATDTNYPTTYIEGTATNYLTNKIYSTYYPNPEIVEYDMETDTWLTYDVAYLTSSNVAPFGFIGDFNVFTDVQNDQVYAWAPVSGPPTEVATSITSNIWQIPAVTTLGEIYSGAPAYSNVPALYRDGYLFLITVGPVPGYETTWFYTLAWVRISPIEYAPGIQLTEVPNGIAAAFGMSEFSGQIVATLIIMMAIMFPTIYVTRNEKVLVMMGILAMSLCVGLGFLELWVEIIIVLAIGGMWGLKVKGIL